MNKVAEKVLPFEDDLEGTAAEAASLGADGGPLDDGAVSYSDEFSEDDEAWLDEELSDEELAALGEEDFLDDDLLEEELDLENEFDTGFDAEAVETESDPTDSTSSTAIVEAESNLNLEGALDIEEDNEELSAGAVVAASNLIPDGTSDSDFVEDELGDEEIDHRPVPRISIGAFCETDRVSNFLERAGVDRRLSKTHLTIHMGGVTKAIDHYQSTSTPNLIVLESVEGGPHLFEQLSQLAEVCDPSTKVIIVGETNDITLYRELMQQGISEYIVNPRSPLQIIKSIAGLYVDPSAPPIGKTVAFVGARGGVGSSTLAHNVAWCSAEEHESDTIVLDLDLPFGTASLDFEQDPTSGLVEALSSPERLDDVLLDRLLQKHTDRLSLFTAPNLLDRDYDLDDQAFDTVIDVVRSAAPTIVIDVPHLWTSWSKRLLQTADEIVITATSDLASFRNTKNLVDVISSSRPNDAPPVLVINQYDAKMSSVQPEQYTEHVGLAPAAIINWEPQLFHTAATNASPILEVGAKSKAAQSIRDISSKVLGKDMVGTKSSRFDIAGMFKRK